MFFFFSAYSTDKYSDTESSTSVTSTEATPKKKHSTTTKTILSPKRRRLTERSPEIMPKKKPIIPLIPCEDVSSDDEDFQKPNETSKLTNAENDKANKESLMLRDLKDLVEDISSSSDLEPGEISN